MVTLHFVRTTENLADFLTREGLPKGDLERFNLKDINISDFYQDLPKQDFSLIEWIQFVDNNPQYLTLNNKDHLPIQSKILSITKGLENVLSVTSPLEILKGRITREEIRKEQQIEFKDIFQKCLQANNFQYIPPERKTEDPISYKFDNGLITVENEKDDFQIWIPSKLVGPLLAYIHLLGHKGLTKMLAELSVYYFRNKYSITRKFVNCCYSCFLTGTGKRHTLLGIYPSPSRAFEEISIDLAENIGTIRGYSHLLIVLCNFSNFLMVFPLKSKTNAEIARTLRDSVLQIFNVERIRSDNGPGFRNIKWLENMSALGVEIINTSSLNPSANGGVERAVQTVKLLYKKILASRPTYNWEYLNFLITKIHNTTINPRNNCKPAELVFGQGSQSQSFLDMENLTPPHHLLKNNKATIESLTKDIKELSKITKANLERIRLITAEKLNKNRVEKDLQVNDYVFVLDRTEILGATRPLKTKLDPSPYVVLSVKYTTVLVRRLSDGFTSLYSKDDVKKYDHTSELFQSIPREIAKVLLNDFTELLSEDFSKIMKFDPLNIPTGESVTSKLISKQKQMPSNNNVEDENEEQYLMEIQKGLELNDLEELQKDKKLKIPEVEIEQNESEEEEEEEESSENDWKNRLRNRVRFKD
jgi:hypothetical protein